MATTREEDYLEAIALVTAEKGYAKVNDISKALGVAPSSVTEMFRRLSARGFINYEKYSGITLTEEGTKLASLVQSRHDTLKEFFLLLGLEEDTADEDACKIEHDLKPETLERLHAFVEYVKENKKGIGCLAEFKAHLQE